MRLAAGLLVALALAGCDREWPTEEPLTDYVQDEDWLEQLRTTPLESNVAVSEEYRIQATFRSGDPVCIADSGGHIHGFYQLSGGNCGDPQESRQRFVSVWADYNTAFYSWDEASATYCGADTEPFELGMEATGEGRLVACIPKLCGEQYVVTAVYLSEDSALWLSDEVDAEAGGPDLIYRLALGTTAETQEADLAEFRAFLSQLRLDGGTFRES